MNLTPIAVTLHLRTLKGYLKQRELETGLSRLACTEEDCCLQVAETKNDENKSGFEVLLRCRRSLKTEGSQNGSQGLWAVEGYSATHTTYRATFDEAESPSAIVEAVRRILDTPILFPQR